MSYPTGIRGRDWNKTSAVMAFFRALILFAVFYMVEFFVYIV